MLPLPLFLGKYLVVATLPPSLRPIMRLAQAEQAQDMYHIPPLSTCCCYHKLSKLMWINYFVWALGSNKAAKKMLGRNTPLPKRATGISSSAGYAEPTTVSIFFTSGVVTRLPRRNRLSNQETAQMMQQFFQHPAKLDWSGNRTIINTMSLSLAFTHDHNSK